MGAKTPTKLKLRRPTYKCDECDKKLLSLQALKSHKYVHKMKAKPKPKAKLVNLLGKSVKRTGKSGPVKKGVDEEDPLVSDVRKIEYECPQCVNRFTVYFSAYRHIQRFHCVDSKGEKVPPNSPDLIKPVRVETCIKCNMRVHSNDVHSCPYLEANCINPLGTACVCMGCQQTFPSMLMFDMHVQGLHSDGVETLFFPNINLFTQWKEHMEGQTQVKYLILGKCNFKQTYRCMFQPKREADAPFEYLCPSSIIVKEFSKSIQVHYYKEHHGHSCKYQLPDKFKKFLSTEFLKKPISGEMLPSESEELYASLKTTLESVVGAAFNADITMLQLLHSKALEMDKILKGDVEPKAVTKKMTDEQITETLESLDGKRKSLDDPLKTEKDEPENVSKTDSAKKKTRTVKDMKDLANKANNNQICFNDTFKDFVDKMNVKKKSEEKPDFKNLRTYSKKKVVKTKIGQFKPNILSPPKKEPKVVEDKDNDNETKDNEEAVISFTFNPDIKPKVEMDYEVIEQEDDCNILVLKI